jgi:hypothetical protein
MYHKNNIKWEYFCYLTRSESVVTKQQTFLKKINDEDIIYLLFNKMQIISYSMCKLDKLIKEYDVEEMYNFILKRKELIEIYS